MHIYTHTHIYIYIYKPYLVNKSFGNVYIWMFNLTNTIAPYHFPQLRDHKLLLNKLLYGVSQTHGVNTILIISLFCVTWYMTFTTTPGERINTCSPLMNTHHINPSGHTQNEMFGWRHYQINFTVFFFSNFTAISTNHQINNMQALVQILTERRSSAKSLSEPTELYAYIDRIQ